MSLKQEQGVKNLVLVLATSSPMTLTKEEVIKNTEIIKATRAGEDYEYPKTNFALVLCI